MSHAPSHPVNLRWFPRFPLSLVHLPLPHRALLLHAQLLLAPRCLHRHVDASQFLTFPALPALPPALLQYHFLQRLAVTTSPWTAFPLFLLQRHLWPLPRTLCLCFLPPLGRERLTAPPVVHRKEPRWLHLPPAHPHPHPRVHEILIDPYLPYPNYLPPPLVVPKPLEKRPNVHDRR